MDKILIVGAGPIGVSLAITLSLHGIDFDIIDKSSSKGKNSKALTLTSATIKSFYKLNLQEIITKHGKKIYDIHVFLKKNPIAKIKKSYIDSPHNYYLTIPQYITEDILNNSLIHDHNVNVKYSELIEIKSENDLYQVILKNKDNIINRKYKYIIGCDGAASTTRKLLNIPFTGKEFDINFLIADIKFSEPLPIKTTTYIKLDVGFIGIFPISNLKYRIVISLQKQDKYPHNITNFVTDIIDKNCNIESKVHSLDWHTTIDIKDLYAGTSFPNNCYLLGDSWHIYSPVGGQTLNTGFQDSIDFGWRLAFKIKHNLSDDIFKDFISTRSKHHLFVKNLTTELTNALILTNKKNNLHSIFPMRIANRIIYRKNLPYLFSGLDCGSNGLINSHIPYVNHLSSEHKFSSYELSYLQYTILHISTLKLTEINAQQLKYIKVTESIMKKLVGFRNYKENYVLAITPAGFIHHYCGYEKLYHKLKNVIFN